MQTTCRPHQMHPDQQHCPCPPLAPHRLSHCNHRGERDRGCQAGLSSHAARIARNSAVPRIERVPCLPCPVCLCYRTQCVASGTAAALVTPTATLGTHAPVPLHPLQHSAGCMSQSYLRLRAFRWNVCACVQILSCLLTGSSSAKYFACALLVLAFCVHGLFL